MSGTAVSVPSLPAPMRARRMRIRRLFLAEIEESIDQILFNANVAG
jgi:hypothetical protein